MDEAQAQDDAFKRELRWRRYARTELRWGAINYIGMGIIATLPYLLFVITRLTFPLDPITERWLGMNLVITIFSFLPVSVLAFSVEIFDAWWKLRKENKSRGY